MIKASAIWLHRLTKLTLLIALLVVAAYVSLGRYYIHYVEEYQDLLINNFVKYTGLPVEVGSLTAEWSRLSFILSFNNIKLHDEDENVMLTINAANFKVSPLESLWNQRILVNSLFVDGLVAQLEEVSPGKWSLAGFHYEDSEDEGFNLDQLLDSILAIDRLEFFNTRLNLQYHNKDVSALHSGEVFLRHHDGFRRIRINANLQDVQGVEENSEDDPIDLLVEAYGDPRDVAFKAKAYLKLDNVDLVDQLPVLHSFGIRPEQVKIDSVVWMDWQPGRVISVQGQVTTPTLDLGGISGRDIPPIENIDIGYRAEKNKQGEWRVWIPNITGSWKQQTIDLKKVKLHLSPDQLIVKLKQLDLYKFSTRFSKLGLLPEKGKGALITLAPKGYLENLQLILNRDLNDEGAYQLEKEFELQAEIVDTSVSSWKGSPEASNINGHVTVHEQGGNVLLSTENFEIGFPGIYDHQMYFDVARANVNWLIDPEKVVVESGLIDLRADHSPAVGQLSLDIPIIGDEAPEMFLAVGLKKTDAKYRDKFIPDILDEQLHGWLDQSIEAGFINQAAFIYEGSLRAGDDAGRTVQLYLDVENGELNYDENWPELTDLKAEVMVDDVDVFVLSPSAKANELELENTVVTVSPLRDKGAWLAVDAKFTGGADKGLEIVNTSQLREWLGDTFSNWSLNGDIDGKIKLGVPLGNEELQPEVDFSSFLSAAKLYIPDYRIGMNEVYGPLNYHSDKGIYSEGLHGSIFDKNAIVTVNQAADSAVTVGIDGRVTSKSIAEWTQLPFMQFVEGETNVKAELLIGSGKDNFSIVSGLKGVAFDLPAPFNKLADETSLFSLELPIGVEKPVMRVSVDNRVAAQFEYTNNELSAGLIALMPNGSEVITKNEFVITGQLNKVEVNEIEGFVREYLAVAASDAPDKGDGLPFKVRDLKFFESNYYNVFLQTASLNVEQVDLGWLLDVKSDKAIGQLLLPSNEAMPVRVDLEKLVFLSQEREQRDAAVDLEKATSLYELQSSIFDNVVPQDIYDADVNIAALYIDEELLGDVKFELRTSKEKLRIKNIEGDIRDIHLSDKENALELVWTKTATRNSSHIRGRIHFDDIGDVLERWNYERAVESKKGVVDINLKWPGAPDQWQLELSQGTISLDVTDGIFLNTTEATGALKVVSVVNLTNIVRRLRLDFTDLYKSGISFDEITGKFEIVGGRLYIVEHLNIESPSSRFRVLGSTDLNAQVLDMDLIATLPIGKNLPWIAALMGGLPAAAVVYGAGKLFENQVDTLSSAVYSLEGKWDDPQLTLNKVFDAKGSKRKKASDDLDLGDNESEASSP